MKLMLMAGCGYVINEMESLVHGLLAADSDWHPWVARKQQQAYKACRQAVRTELHYFSKDINQDVQQEQSVIDMTASVLKSCACKCRVAQAPLCLR
jgi:hypothetical protein